MAAEIAQVHKLTTLLAERVEFLADLACSRHGYMDHVKTRTSAKADKKGLKRRAGDNPLKATLRATSVPAASGAHTSPMEVDDATSASSNTTRAPMDVDSATVKGPSTTEGAMPVPTELANDILAAIPLLPNEWPLAKIDLILQNTDKYDMSWRRFLFVHELLRTFNEKAAVNVLRTNATSLVEHLVEFLSEWIVTFVEPAREVTKVRDPELLFLHLVLSLSFYLLTCKMGFAPIKRTCTIVNCSSCVGHCTDRTILVDRQSRKTKRQVTRSLTP